MLSKIKNFFTKKYILENEENKEITAEEIPKVSTEAKEMIDIYTAVDYTSQKEPVENAEKLILQGICLGDIFGSIYEGWGVREGEDPDTADPFKRKKSTYTDDTILTLAVCETTKKALLQENLTNEEIIELYRNALKKWAKQYPDAGYGGNFYMWAVLDHEDARYKSFGDGGAMRSGIIGALCKTYSDTVRYAVCSAMPTHSHPEGVKGAVIAAVSVWMALHGYSKKEIFTYAIKWYPDGYKNIKEKKEKNYMSPDISIEELIALQPFTLSLYTQIAVPEAIANFVYSNSYEKCIRNAIRYKCDSDTVAAISGGIAAAYYGETNFEGIDVPSILKKKLDSEIINFIL